MDRSGGDARAAVEAADVAAARRDPGAALRRAQRLEGDAAAAAASVAAYTAQGRGDSEQARQLARAAQERAAEAAYWVRIAELAAQGAA